MSEFPVQPEDISNADNRTAEDEALSERADVRDLNALVYSLLTSDAVACFAKPTMLITLDPDLTRDLQRFVIFPEKNGIKAWVQAYYQPPYHHKEDTPADMEVTIGVVDKNKERINLIRYTNKDTTRITSSAIGDDNKYFGEYPISESHPVGKDSRSLTREELAEIGQAITTSDIDLLHMREEAKKIERTQDSVMAFSTKGGFINTTGTSTELYEFQRALKETFNKNQTIPLQSQSTEIV